MGIPFTNKKAAHPPTPEVKAAWQALGGNITTNVPMLEMPDGKVYTQSSAVLRFVARKGGFYPTDIESQYEVDKLIAAADDFRTISYGIIFKRNPRTPAQYKALLMLHMGNFERILANNDYFVANTFSVAD